MKLTYNPLKTLEPSLKRLHKYNLRITLKSGSEPLIFPQKAKVLDNAPCKNIQPHQWEDSNRSGHSNKLWE